MCLEKKTKTNKNYNQCQVYDFDQEAQRFDRPAGFYQLACSFHNQIGPNYVKHIVLYLKYCGAKQKGGN